MCVEKRVSLIVDDPSCSSGIKSASGNRAKMFWRETTPAPAVSCFFVRFVRFLQYGKLQYCTYFELVIPTYLLSSSRMS